MLITNENPKIFYSPEEIKSTLRIVRLTFNGIGAMRAISDDEIKGSLQHIYIEYEKVELRNCQYDYVYVNKEQMQYFKNLYFKE